MARLFERVGVQVRGQDVACARQFEVRPKILAPQVRVVRTVADLVADVAASGSSALLT